MEEIHGTCPSDKKKIWVCLRGRKERLEYKVKAEAWDTCHSVVISWLVNAVSEPIKKSIIFVSSAEEIWKQLEMRFSVANGPRKYKLSKQTYEMRQNGKKVAGYYTELRSIWEELESLKEYPANSALTSEVIPHLNARRKDEEEQKLFQLLSGLDDMYAPQRSHILMMDPLPSVVNACGILQQKESQREINQPETPDHEGMAMSTKKGNVTCTNCGKTGHLASKCWACKSCGKNGHAYEECWWIKGFPTKNSRSHRDSKSRNKETGGRKPPGRGGKSQGKDKGEMDTRNKMTANYSKQEGNISTPHITAEQLE
ncbi:Gag-Pol polyprotein [Bienertia sinuspersici]